MKRKYQESPASHAVLVSPKHTREKLGIGNTKLYELIGDGTLKSVKIDRSRRIFNSSIDAYVDRLVDEQQAA